MKNLFIFGFGLLLLASCSETAEKKIISVEKKTAYTPSKEVLANQMMTVSIEGMTCEHGCGGTIRKTLKESGAVAQVSFDFEADRKKNTATVKFDKNQTSPEKMIAMIEKINNNQYKTSDVKVSDIVSESTKK